MFKKGQRVAILNTTITGRFIFEGWATVIKPPKRGDDYYDVCFEDDQVFPRLIDEAAQTDPAGYARALNERLAV